MNTTNISDIIKITSEAINNYEILSTWLTDSRSYLSSNADNACLTRIYVKNNYSIGGYMLDEQYSYDDKEYYKSIDDDSWSLYSTTNDEYTANTYTLLDSRSYDIKFQSNGIQYFDIIFSFTSPLSPKYISSDNSYITYSDKHSKYNVEILSKKISYNLIQIYTKKKWFNVSNTN